MNWTYSHSDPAMMLWTAAVLLWSLDWPKGANVLELGCAETDWLEQIQAQNPDICVTGVDVHSQPRGNVKVGSAMDANLFEPETFDAIVLLGALEHFGLGFYGDPIDDDGDTKTVQNIARWLKPGGWAYWDVPCQPTYSVRPNRHFRDYSPASIQERLIAPSGLIERCRGYSWPEPNAGAWCDEPKEPLVPYWFVAVVADKES